MVTMKNIILLSCFLGTVWSCDFCFNHTCHDKLILFNRQIAGQIAIDKTGNIAYMYYAAPNGKGLNVVLDLTYLDFQINHDMGYSFAKAVDQDTRILYLGSEHGLFTFNRTSTRTEFFGFQDEPFWQLQYEKKLYYVDFPPQKLYSYQNGISQRIDALVNYVVTDFIVDNTDTVYFVGVNDDGVYATYVLEKNSDVPRKISDDIFALSTDRSGEPYFLKIKGRGIYDKDMSEVAKIGNGLPLTFGFDKDNNIIYFDAGASKVYYLRKTENREFCS